MNLKEQIKFMGELELIASDCLETGNRCVGWSGADTLKISKIRTQLETFQKGGRPRKWKSNQERIDFHNAKRAKKRKADKEK